MSAPVSRIALAIAGQHDQLLQILSLYGPGDEVDEEGRTIFHYCVDRKAWNVVQFLLQIGVPVDIKDGNLWTALHHSCKKGCLESVGYLIQLRANPREIDSVGSAPLHVACFSGNIDIVRLLLQVGADINQKCKLGWSPLHYAAERGHDAVVELLLNNGAAVEAGKNYRDGRVELSPVDMAQSLTIRNKLEVNMLESLMGGFSL
eukprot:Phypoly_transcript_11189.p1 GENE.Phypoly_transcript_11189~~Phypoly_transcript_11189.p1  ORF type:complete len:204 (+),score=18.83 Phypoly_transcript_11189:54-665(+)